MKKSSFVFFSLSVILDFPQKAAIWSMDFWSFFCRIWSWLAVEKVFMSSANWEVKMVFSGFGMLETYKRNRIGLRADPWGTPELILMSGDCRSLILKYV